MVQKFLRYFDREMFSLHQAAFFLAFSAVVSKVLALFRDRFLAGTFGAGTTLDIYYASFVLPDYIYNFLIFIVSASALIPLFLEKISKSPEEGRSFLNEVLTVFFIITVICVAALFFLIPYLIPFVAPGFSAAEKSRVVDLSRILLLSPLLLGLSNLVSSVIQSLRRFFIYALAPVFYNLGIILGILVFYKWWSMKGVVLGVVVGAFFHFAIQVPTLLKSGFFPKFTSAVRINEIIKIVKLSFPRAIGLTLNQIVLTIITAIASLVGPGSIAVFNLATNLQTIPLTVIGVSYSVAAFPTLAQFYFKNEKENFLKHVSIAGRHIIFWSLPVSVLFIVLRAQIVRVILGVGKFTWADTRLTAASLALLSLAIAAQGMLFLLVRAYYAAGRTKKPLAINFCSSLFVVVGSFFFLEILKNFESVRYFLARLLRVSDVAGMEMLILPLVFSAGTILNAVFLWIFFQKDFGRISRELKRTLMEVLSASLIIGIISYVSLMIFGTLFDLKTFIGIFFQGFFAGISGISGGILTLFFLKNTELKETIFSLRRKLWKEEIPVVAAEPEKLP